MGDQAYETDRILIATGSKPAMPPIPGLTLPGVVTSDEMLEGKGVYCKKLVIIGGGVFWRVLQGFRNWIGQGREFCLVRRKELVSDG